jgi:hypothetical protein
MGGEEQSKVYRITVANITREALEYACRFVALGGATIFQGTGYCADYAEGATEYSFTLETVCTLSEARKLWARIALCCKEESVYVTVNGSHAALWYRDKTVYILSN